LLTEFSGGNKWRSISFGPKMLRASQI
jgi:hypothetical protein